MLLRFYANIGFNIYVNRYFLTSSLIIFFLVLVCVAFLEHQKYSKEAYDKEITKISAMDPDGPKDYDIYCTIIMILLETSLKLRKAGDLVFLSEALGDLKFRDECIEVLISNQQNLYEHFLEMKLLRPMKKLEYRINISLMER